VHPGTGPPQALAQRIVDDHQYGCVGLDLDGTVVFANAAAARLAGVPADDLVGSNMADYLDADHAALARQVLEEQTARGNHGLPTIWAIRQPGGEVVHAEIGAKVYLDDPDFTGVVLRLRPFEAERHFDAFVTGLAHGHPLEQNLASIARWVEARLAGSRVTVAHDWDGQRFTRAIPTALPAVLDGTMGDGGLPAPWTSAARTGSLAAADLGDLPPEVAAAAAACGLAACWVLPIEAAHKDEPDGVLLMWRSEPGPPYLTHTDLMRKAQEACSLAFARHDSTEALHRAARTDHLTGVANRAAFQEALAPAVREARRGTTALLYLDLDGFKQVNDTHGHPLGDRVLVEVVERVASAIRPDDLLARLGGDEFAVLCGDIAFAQDAVALADHLVSVIGAIREVDGIPIDIGVSIGIALPETDDDIDASGAGLVSAADRALYLAKARGTGSWVIATRLGTVADIDDHRRRAAGRPVPAVDALEKGTG